MLLFCAMFPSGPALVALAKRAYQVRAGKLWPAREEPEPVREPVYRPSANPGALEQLSQDTDLFAAHKPWTDVLVSGAACSARGPVRMLDTGVQVGPLRKTVRVWGHRRVQLGMGGRLRFSEPEPFTEMPLTWDHAYGGRDTFAEEKARPARKPFARPAEERGLFGYPRNPAGRGFYLDVERERLDGVLAPNLEDTDDPVTPDRLLACSPLDWLDRPAPACYQPVDWHSFPRLAFWLGAQHEPPGRPVYEARKGLLRAAELGGRTELGPPDPRAYACAPPGLAGARLQGNERLMLWNLHPTHERLELELPGERPSLLVEPPGCGIRELPAVLQTVHLEPAAERVTLTWTGQLRVAAPYPEEACREMRQAAR